MKKVINLKEEKIGGLIREDDLFFKEVMNVISVHGPVGDEFIANEIKNVFPKLRESTVLLKVKKTTSKLTPEFISKYY